MSQFRVEIVGDKKLRRALSRLINDVPDVAAATMLKSVLYVQSRIPGYPPPPPESTYRRTGTLGRTVTALAGREAKALSRVETARGQVKGFVGTRLSYALYVIGREEQAWMHRGRWWTLEEVAENATGGIQKIWEQAIREFVDRSVD